MYYSEIITEKIVRPLRDQYRLGRLGPVNFNIVSRVNGRNLNVRRRDLTISNTRGEKLHVSKFQVENEKLPCVIFLHSNNGSRVQGLEYVQTILGSELELVIFDCSGSGISQGQYVTLGVQQSQDLQTVIGQLKKQGTTKVSLWGRSMGAVTAIMYAARHPENIYCCIYDSPFSCLSLLIKQLAKNHTGLPEFIFGWFLGGVDKQLQSKCGISLNDFKMEDLVAKIDKPAIFIASPRDRLVSDEHTKKLYQKYAGQKHIFMTMGQHHERREEFILHQCANFIRAKVSEQKDIRSSKVGFGLRVTERYHMQQHYSCIPCRNPEQEFEIRPYQKY